MQTNTNGTSGSEVREPVQVAPRLTEDPRRFWLVGADFDRLVVSQDSAVRSVLERLGPPPLPKNGFPLVGFLATVYDHVAVQARAATLDF